MADVWKSQGRKFCEICKVCKINDVLSVLLIIIGYECSGRKYYWHIYSGGYSYYFYHLILFGYYKDNFSESTWSPPSSFYTACEYQIRLAAEEACTQNASLYNTESATNFAHVKEEPHGNKAIVRLNKEQEYYQRNMHTISSENMHFPYEIPLPGECSSLAVKEEPLEHDIAVPTEEHLTVKGPIEFKKKSAVKNIRKREDC
uniref:WW domain-containing protein n=1 Tax=Heterorhabditis bacteriophora TaxID=37862 RepID=A0A1I7X6S2_HETBA